MHGHKKPKYNSGKKSDSKGNRSDCDERFDDKIDKLKKKKARWRNPYDACDDACDDDSHEE